jgi:putative peptidoglycan lipid II flippase
LNIALITALLLSKNLPKSQIIWYLSFGVIAGGLAQVIAHLIAAKKYKILKLLYIGCVSKKQTDISTFKKHFLPSVLGNSTAQISAFIDTWLATFLISGSISYLYYANRLFQLPFALFAIATSTVFFPEITKKLKDGKEEESLKSMKKVFWMLLYLLIMASIVAIIDSREIVKLIFQHGAFTPKDTRYTSVVLIMYMLGLIPYGLNKLFSSYLYATHKHLKVAKFSVISLTVNIVFSVALIFPLKVYGLALASSLGGAVLFVLTLKEFGFREFLKFFEKKYVLLMFLTIFGSIIAAIAFKEILWLVLK